MQRPGFSHEKPGGGYIDLVSHTKGLLVDIQTWFLTRKVWWWIHRPGFSHERSFGGYTDLVSHTKGLVVDT